MTIGLLLPILLNLFKKLTWKILKTKLALLAGAAKKDLAAPITGIKKVIKKIAGKEETEEGKGSVDKKLDEICVKEKERRKKKKEWKKSVLKDNLLKKAK